MRWQPPTLLWDTDGNIQDACDVYLTPFLDTPFSCPVPPAADGSLQLQAPRLCRETGPGCSWTYTFKSTIASWSPHQPKFCIRDLDLLVVDLLCSHHWHGDLFLTLCMYPICASSGSLRLPGFHQLFFELRSSTMSLGAGSLLPTPLGLPS